jgi:hypothetical protein
MMTPKHQYVDGEIDHGEVYRELDIRSKQISAAMGFCA